MAWDFETDPEFQKKLDWIETFMEEEVEPISYLGMAAWSSAGREKFIKPLQQKVKAQGLWACHLGPELGGQGFGLGLSVVTDPAARAWMGEGGKGAFGWPGAFGTWWQADPEKQMILIYMIQNSMPLGPEAVANMGQSQRMGARLALPMWQKAVYGAVKP